MRIPIAIRNFPIPEPHLGLLGVSLVLHFLKPVELPFGRVTAFVGGALVGGGAALAGAATAAAGIDLADPDGLVTAGPFAVSRNPMYEAWTAISAGVALGMGSAWPLILLPALVVLVDREVRAEERELQRRFGAAYQAYAKRVPRYVIGRALKNQGRR